MKDRIAAWLGLGSSEVNTLTSRHLDPRRIEALELMGFLRSFTRGEGTFLIDSQGRRYVDLLAGYGSLPLGHHPREVWDAIGAVRDRQPPSFVLMAPEALPAVLARELARRLPPGLEIAFFGSSGSEAVDGALKLARAATRRDAFVHARGGYHGSTFGATSVTSDPRLAIFGTLLPSTEVAWLDVDAIERRLRKRDVAAVILEPLQAEGGIRLAPPGSLRRVAELCRKYGTLLVLDEVQTGLGRTGVLFALEDEDVVPDVVLVAKGLSGGLVPIGAYVTTDAIWRRAYGSLDHHEVHCATFRGGPIACAAALATLETIDARGLCARARALGDELGARLSKLAAKHALVRATRGRGLLHGIEVDAPAGLPSALVAQWVVVGLLERGFVTQVTSLAPGVVRVEPALTIESEQLASFVDALDDVLASHARGALSSFAKAGASALRVQLRHRLAGLGVS